MKKICFTLMLLSVCAATFAKGTLKDGVWKLTDSSKGVTMTYALQFLDDKAGTVYCDDHFDFDVSNGVIKASGAAGFHTEGKFTRDGKQLIIKWDTGSCRFVTDKPFSFSSQDAQFDGMEAQCQTAFDAAFQQIKDEAAGQTDEERFNGIRIGRKKLTLKYRNDEGKTEKCKYRRSAL